MFRIIGADGEVYGPVSADELREWISEGRANALSLIQTQTEGSQEWRALGTFPEFAMALSAVTLRVPSPLPVVAMGSAMSNKTNGLAITGFILGLLSVPSFCCCCLALPCSILGLIFSCMSLSQIRRNPLQGGKAMAIVGIIFSILGLLLWVAGMMFGVISAVTDPTFFQ